MPDRGTSMAEYGAMLLVLAAIAGVLVVLTDIPTMVQVKTRAAICEVFQGQDCDESAATAQPPGEVPGGGVPGELPGVPGDPAEQDEEGAGQPPQGGQQAQPAAPAVLTPELLDRYQRCEQAVPAGFREAMGYTPPCADTPYGRRAIRADGECSAPIIGNEGRSFDFTFPCQAHDFGYDVQRYYAQLGTTHNPDTRRAADRRFREDLVAHCETTRSGFNEWSCRNWAGIYATAVEWWSRLQGQRVP